MTNANTVAYSDPDTADNSSGELNLGDLISTIWERRWIILGITLFGTIIGLIYALAATPIYRSDILIQVEESDVSTKSLTGDLAPLLGNSSATTAEIEILRSRAVIGEAVNHLKLQYEIRPKYFPGFGRWFASRNVEPHSQKTSLAPALFGLDAYAWGGEQIEINDFTVPSAFGVTNRWTLVAGSDQSYILLDASGERFLSGTVGIESESGGVKLTLTKLVARPGTEFEIVNSTPLQAISNLQLSLNVGERGKQSGIINAALEGDDAKKISAILNAIGESYVQLNVNRKSAEAEKTLRFLDEQLPALKKELDASEERFNRYRIRSGTIDLTEEAKLILKQAVDSTQGLLELQQKRLELVQRFTPVHPSVIAVDNQIAAIQRQTENLKSSIGRLPSTQQDALRLTRDVTVNNQLYTSLLNTAQQLRVLKAGKIGNVRLVDYAVPGERPVQPKKALIVVIASLASLICGLSMAFLISLLLGGVESSDEIERSTGIPVLAAIPHSESQKQIENRANIDKHAMHLLAHSSPQDLTVESLRSLRTALQFSMIDAANNLVMISGPSPGVGKSFVSANLAVVLAAGGKRVLLIDCDLRRGHLHEFCGTPRIPGLSGVIGESVKLADAIHRQLLPGLDFLSTGLTVPNPAELLGSSRFGKLLTDLAQDYDVVVIDTPPVLAVTDATIVGRHVGTNILNLRHGKHAMAEIQESVRRFNLGGISLKGILLNNVPRKSLGYGRYRYQGAYYNYDYSQPRKN